MAVLTDDGTKLTAIFEVHVKRPPCRRHKLLVPGVLNGIFNPLKLITVIFPVLRLMEELYIQKNR